MNERLIAERMKQTMKEGRKFIDALMN